MWLILSGDVVWKFLVAICCVLCRCLCSFFVRCDADERINIC